MSKQEEVYNINDELIDQEVQAPVKSNKIKYAIAIIIGVLITAVVSIILVGHFKFDWFKSETYKIEANIQRSNFKANYFSEEKNMNIKVSFSNGQKEEKEFFISTNFVVILTERKELGKGDFLNTASLVILDSNLKTAEEEIKLTKFQIFDESTIKELESNPDGSKYPMSIFTFHDDGALEDIKLPDNMDKYNADSIVELIKNVIPKLTRNRKEDISNGLEIKEKKNNKVMTIIETQAPRTFETFQGSKYSKIVERDIEDNEITDIRVHSSAFFQNEEEENVDDLGLRDFSYDTHSEINSMVSREEKETAELIQNLAGRFNFISSEKLIENILEKERKENEIQEKITDLEKEGTSLRNLGFNFNVDKTFNSKLGSARFGNDGVTAEVSKTWSGNKKIFQFIFPPFPAISLNIYAGGSLGFSVKFTNVGKTSLQLTLSGSLTASAEVALGAGDFAKVAAGAKGTIINASGSATVTSSGVTKSFSISGGKIEAYVTAYIKIPFIGKKKLWDKSCTIFNGWSS